MQGSCISTSPLCGPSPLSLKVETLHKKVSISKAQLPGGEMVAEYSVCEEVTKTACDVFRF